MGQIYTIKPPFRKGHTALIEKMVRVEGLEPPRQLQDGTISIPVCNLHGYICQSTFEQNQCLCANV